MAKQMTCVVTLAGREEFQHSVEVTAETLYEAAVRGLRELRLSEWAREEAYEGARLQVSVKTPAVVHTVDLRRLKEWLGRKGGRSPREVALRAKLRELLEV